MFRLSALVMSALLISPLNAIAQSREQKVLADREKVEAEGFWIYNDLVRVFEQAKRTGKPLMVALRCIPCVECVKLDDELVNRDRRVRPLLEKFVWILSTPVVCRTRVCTGIGGATVFVTVQLSRGSGVSP